MLQTTFYDTTRFSSEAQAREANEVYRVEYSSSQMDITDPDGVRHKIQLNYEPRFGLDVSDQVALESFLNASMEQRDNKQN